MSAPTAPAYSRRTHLVNPNPGGGSSRTAPGFGREACLSTGTPPAAYPAASGSGAGCRELGDSRLALARAMPGAARDPTAARAQWSGGSHSGPLGRGCRVHTCCPVLSRHAPPARDEPVVAPHLIRLHPRAARGKEARQLRGDLLSQAVPHPQQVDARERRAMTDRRRRIGADSGVTTRVSVDSAGTQVNGESFFPALSANGRSVAFSSEATDLVAGDTNGALDIFVDDRLRRR
jgi:hypothetical protein